MNQQHELFIKHIIEDMVKKYGTGHEDAQRAIEHYGFREMAASYPNSTFHYPPDFWAEEIHRVEFDDQKYA